MISSNALNHDMYGIFYQNINKCSSAIQRIRFLIPLIKAYVLVCMNQELINRSGINTWFQEIREWEIERETRTLQCRCPINFKFPSLTKLMFIFRLWSQKQEQERGFSSVLADLGLNCNPKFEVEANLAYTVS